MTVLAVERRAAGDDEELFRLYGDVFGQELSEASRRRWRWQYLDNPHTGEDGPEIWVARDGDRLLGQYASMPVRLWWGDREVRSSWGMDVFLRAEARGRGVGEKLFTAWSDHVDVALGLGLTPSSYGLFKKLRYEDVGPVPFFQKVLDPEAVAARHLGPALGRAAGPVVDLALRVLKPERPAEDGSVTVAPAGEVGAEYDALWEGTGKTYRMCVRRDAAYVRWKYRAAPHRRYQIHEARRQDGLVGFAVSRHEDYRGLRLGWILDVFTDAADTGTQDALVGAVLAEFRQAGVARAQAFALHRGLGQVLGARGFLAGTSPMQFCVRARAASAEVFADRGSWHVVFGDSDMDR